VTLRAALQVDLDSVIAEVDERIFGSFVEHMGRCVYTGVFEPGHGTADDDGFRGDVMDLVRELGVSVVRYPGGNFASGYQWEDGVGPVSERPVRLDPAWGALERNTFGLDEFHRWVTKVGARTVMTLNLGTRGVPDALALLEYANHSGGTQLSELRRLHGRGDPYAIRTWCLGNELDGPWQLGHKTADEYGRLAAETARAMRMLDPDLELVVSGSSSADMPTFGEWEETVLGHTLELVDLVSAHAYYDPDSMDVDSFLGSAVDLDRNIRRIVAIADRVAAEAGSPKRLGVSVDEWNVWYLGRHRERGHPGRWGEALRLCEDPYTVTDSVVVGSLLMTLLRNCDRVKLACQAQLVNTIAPIRTEPGGDAWRQATFHPFALTARHATGRVLSAVAEAPKAVTERHGEVPIVDALATHDEGHAMKVFAVNRSRSDTCDLTVDLGDLTGYRVTEHLVVADHDLSAANTREQPGRVVPRSGRNDRVGGHVHAELPPVSWTILRFEPD
jgi:alpha-N-arabinofuranosidase